MAMIRDKEISLWARAIAPFFTILWCRQQEDVEIPHEVFAQLRQLARELARKMEEGKGRPQPLLRVALHGGRFQSNRILKHEGFPLTDRNREAGAKLVKETPADADPGLPSRRDCGPRHFRRHGDARGAETWAKRSLPLRFRQEKQEVL